MLVWQKTISSPTNIVVVSIQFVKNKLVIAGQFQGSLCQNTNCVNSNGGTDLFIITVTPSGILQIKTEGNVGDEQLGGFTTDSQGNMYFSGAALGQVQLGSKSYSTTANNDFFLMKKDSLYNPLWTKIGHKGGDFNVGFGSDLKFLGGSLFMRMYGQTVMESSIDTLGCHEYCDYVCEFDLNGNFIREAKNIISGIGGGAYPWLKDSVNNLYYISTNKYIAKENKNDSIYWTQSFNLTQDPASVIPKSGKFYLSGYGVNSSNNKKEYYLVKGDITSGICNQYYNIPTQNIEFAQFYNYIGDKLLLYGRFKDTLTLGNNHLSSIGWTSFVAVVTPDYLTIVEELSLHSSNLEIYPNPTSNNINVSYSNTNATGELQIRVNTMQGQIIYNETISDFNGNLNKQITLGNVAKGIYLIELNSQSFHEVKKVIIE